MIDYHIHTSLCNHAQGEMEDYVSAAIKKGLIEICFLDHLILHDAGRHNSMRIDEIPAYFAEAEKLKLKYKNQITVKVGLEIDFDPENIHTIERLTGEFEFDVIGSAVHFIDGVNIASRREAAKISEKRSRYLAKKYFETLYEMLDYSYFDFICHFDVIKKTGRKVPDDCSQIIHDIIIKAADKGIAMEVNTGGFLHPAGECYPSPSIIQKCIDADIPLLLSSDAHKPFDVGSHFEEAIKLLSSLGCKTISSFDRRKINFISIKNLQK